MPEQRRWADLNPRQRRGVVVAGTIQMLLLGSALWDLRRRTDADLRGGKRVWRLAVFVNWIGPVAYFLYGRRR